MQLYELVRQEVEKEFFKHVFRVVTNSTVITSVNTSSVEDKSMSDEKIKEEVERAVQDVFGQEIKVIEVLNKKTENLVSFTMYKK